MGATWYRSVASEQDDPVVSRVHSFAQRLEGRAGAEGEAGCQDVRGRGDGFPVVVVRSDDDYQARHAAIALLAGGASKLRLGISEARDGFYGDRDGATRQERIKGAKVTGNVEWGLELPSPSVSNSYSQSSQQVNLGRVPQATRRGIKADMEAKANRSGVLGEISDAEIVKPARFHTADPGGRSADGSSNLDLPQSRG
jgi:hypothetical protein